MKERSRKLFEKALDNIEVAEQVLDMGKPEIAVGRAYYAMFYIAEASLYERGLEFKTHGQSLGHTEKNLPKQRNSIRNFIRV